MCLQIGIQMYVFIFVNFKYQYINYKSQYIYIVIYNLNINYFIKKIY